mmetsp:Transcript_38982/g.110408  ORF Transcript_38982/g.110408 Transcript_38982/m.110408 type:complete len:175 (-) Transcript_38982:490-1014(-)
MLHTAELVKQEGNRLFGEQMFVEAAAKYSEAVEAGPPGHPQLAVYYANRAACMLKLDQHQDAVEDCSSALGLQPNYVKALVRRFTAYEKLENLELALADAQKVVELDSSNSAARATVKRLEPVVAEQREKLKEEMMGKLKDLGNMVLGNFGLSVDNFKMVQDPNTGGYSINFQQ